VNGLIGMGALPYAVHRSIVVVDVEKFGDQSRTNAHQVAVRDGLFRSLRWSFTRSGVPWERCRCEDRGDGALVLIPPDVPKNLLAGPLPAELAAVLEKHNAVCEQQARIRLRAVLHAGEVRLDDYGATGAAVNLAFRLLESSALRSVLAGSPGVLALMASEWFFQEVIRHEPASGPAAYRPVPVSVKETETTAWACLLRPADRGRDMPPTAAWRDPATVGDGGPVVVGNIPQRPVASQARAGLLGQMTGPDAGVRVVVALTGARGAGKTQLAAAIARARIAAGWRLVAWVDAEDRRMMLVGRHQVACALGLAGPSAEARDSAVAVRHHLEADGDLCLLVLDNAVDADAVMPFLPAAGRSQVVITSTRRALGNLGQAVTVDTFTAEEAIAYLTERTGLADAEGARAIADELGHLPLALAQAAAVIDGQRLDYGTYLGRLRAMAVADYLSVVPGDPYPHSVAQAILLSTAGITDKPGHCRALLDLVAVLSPAGVPRQYLQQAGRLGLLHRSSKSGKRGMAISPAAVDALLGRLADASLISISVGEGVGTAHRLVMRVTREQLARGHHLNPVAAAAASLLADLLVPGEQAWTQPHAVDELIKQITALNDHLPDGTWTAVPDRHLAEAVLALRGRALWYLNDTLTLPSHAIAFGTALVADSTRVLGPDHPGTLTARNNLAWAYETAGDLEEATRYYEQTVADRTRVLGPDHPDTLTSRQNLVFAYLSAGRFAEAISLGEQVLTDSERVLGPDHLVALSIRAPLSSAYARAGRHEEAVSMGEQTLGDRQRVLGPDHPATFGARNNLAYVYAAAGRYEEAMATHEHVLADRQRVLGPCHPDTFTSRHNLALTYELAGQREEAIRQYQQTLADCTRILGPDHPITRTIQQGLATHPPRASGLDRYIRRRLRP
jgi:tetratricopeptide (TPR) repeat protein